jgi:aryl-phospho-beta-D-glucosidase BglC (GH1 family)
LVTRCGDRLCLDGSPWTFTGVNAYEAATDWSVNAGCGGDLTQSDLDTLFASLAPNDVVRFWAFQALATNYATGQLDWAGIDRVIDTAAKYGIKVIPALSGESGGCDDNEWKDAAWYDGGYVDVYDSSAWPASTPLSYRDYMQDFLERYGNNPTIAMVELVSEPSPTESGYVCVNETAAAQALRSFFDTVGAEAHSIAPNLLIESGMQGVGQCGAITVT